jgi:hypothetical protein
VKKEVHATRTIYSTIIDAARVARMCEESDIHDVPCSSDKIMHIANTRRPDPNNTGFQGSPDVVE